MPLAVVAEMVSFYCLICGRELILAHYQQGATWTRPKSTTARAATVSEPRSLFSSSIVETWLIAKGLDDEDWDTCMAALRKAVEETPESKEGETFQSMVEWFLLSDIRDCIRGLQ